MPSLASENKYFFSSKELYAMEVDCEPENVPAWCTMFQSRLWAKSADAYKALYLTDAQFEGLTSAQLAKARGLLAVLAGELLACISKKTERGRVLHKELALAEQKRPGSTANNARAIMRRIEEITKPTHGGDLSRAA